ncbi:MAG: glutamine synthetase adenylyltransferase [Planctomycetaceae bacterium]
MLQDFEQFLVNGLIPEADAVHRLKGLGFEDAPAALRRLHELCPDLVSREALAPCLPALMIAVSESASPDISLLNFDRYVQSVQDPVELYRYLRDHPRAVEILVKLFVGSQFLTEILLRHPDYLIQLTQYRQLADFKHRQKFFEEISAAADEVTYLPEKLDAVRSVQNWEILRLGACDTFRLMDHKSVTLQLALLADSVVQCYLTLIAQEMQIDVSDFAVIAFGKLGGEELNYSSDIDLMFIASREAERFWGLGQRLIKALIESTGHGFLYRVDMRLRPWGRSGPLVTNVDAYIDYLKKSGQIWEKQALLKARCIAGNQTVGEKLLKQIAPIIFHVSPDEVRSNVIEMKARIEAKLEKTGRQWGDVKSGHGSIRDVEFVTQGLQLIYGASQPLVRSTTTLDGLVRLADMGLIQADEYRRLSTGYVFLRTIEHAMQLMHNKPMHRLPQDRRELSYLARRLDFPGPEELVSHYEQHCREIRAIFDKYMVEAEEPQGTPETSPHQEIRAHLGTAAVSYEEYFSDEKIDEHIRLLSELDEQNVVRVQAIPLDESRWELTVVGFDQMGDLSVIAGLLFVFGYDIEFGNVFTGSDVAAASSKVSATDIGRYRKFVNVFVVRSPLDVVPPAVWTRYESDLSELLRLMHGGHRHEAQGQLAKRVAGALRGSPTSAGPLLPVEISVDNSIDPESTVLQIQAEDTSGFLYELTNALSLSDTSIVRMQIHSSSHRVLDTLHVVDGHGRKIEDTQRLRELRVAIVLIKHFTHLLPSSPNPESALLHFRELLEQLFTQTHWINQLAQLQQPEVLQALAKLLGVSDFLWDDFLKLQHSNLFPIVTDLDALQHPQTRASLSNELNTELATTATHKERRAVLNAFKDREMLRADLRHILGLQSKFGMFSQELTNIAEVIVDAALRQCQEELQAVHGRPLSYGGDPSPFAVCALGKFGGRELGFASDIELMFVYENDGQTSGRQPITTLEFYQHLVECFRKSIHAKRKGIFEVDLRLRPYGKAGSLAIALEAFQKYFSLDGPAWPYERQALVKLRPVGGDAEFGQRVTQLRDQLIYTGQPFDVNAMRAMREKQIQQLVKAGTFNAKLSSGGLADCEYLVQGLQITYGHDQPSLRTPNTREALKALEAHGVISTEDRIRLRDAYRFLRQVIDALRMVRGDARDLTVPPIDSEEFEFLARRLGYREQLQKLLSDIEHHTTQVIELSKLLDTLPS